MSKFQQVGVPVASFVLAVLMAILGGSSSRAFARRFADPTGDMCLSDLRNARVRAKTRNLHIDPVHPNQSTGSIRTRTILDLYGGAITAGAPAKTKNNIIFASELHFFLNGTTPDGTPTSETLTLSLPPIEDSNIETFELRGIRWKRNIECQFHETGNDLGRLLRSILATRAAQGNPMTYDSNSTIFAFKQVTASETFLENHDLPCDADLLAVPLVVQSIQGTGLATGLRDD